MSNFSKKNSHYINNHRKLQDLSNTGMTTETILIIVGVAIALGLLIVITIFAAKFLIKMYKQKKIKEKAIAKAEQDE